MGSEAQIVEEALICGKKNSELTEDGKLRY
jgi:hypothetical protein